MANESDIDSWKTGPDSAESGGPNSRRKIVLVDARTDGTGRGANHHYYHHHHHRVQARATKSGPEIRHINPAIYTESVDEEEHGATQMRSVSDREEDCHDERAIDASHGDCECTAIDLPAVRNVARDVERAGERTITGQSTYRCYTISLPDTALSLEPSTDRSAASSGLTARVERRCRLGGVGGDGVSENVCRNEAVKREKYVLDNRQVVRISTTSFSSPSIADSARAPSGSPDLARRIAHTEWARRKHVAAQRKREEEERAARMRQEEAERTTREKEEKARLEKENFLKWVEGKRRQELDRKAMLENELALQKRLKEIEDKAAVAKALYLRQWIHKKQDEQKARHKEQELKQRKMNEEREKRLEQSSQAYEKWRKNSKNKPKPATQGLLPHQKAKPTYVNPIPWQSIVEIDPDDAQEDIFSETKGNVNQLEMSGERTIAAHQ